MNEENAVRLVRLLVNRTPLGGFIQNAQVQLLALSELGLEGGALDEALDFAGNAGWIEDGPLPGTISITADGRIAGQ